MRTKPFEELKQEIEEAIQARDWGRIERLANADLRHQRGVRSSDYMLHWCNVGRCFAYATPDYTWGEFEKEFAVIIGQVARWRVVSDLIDECKRTKDAEKRDQLCDEIVRIVEEDRL